MHMSATNKEIVEKVNAAFAAGNTAGFLSFCAEDVAWTMVGDKTVKGKTPFANGWHQWETWSRQSLRSRTSSPRMTSPQHTAT